MPEQRDWRQESDDKAREVVEAFSYWVNSMGHNNQAFVQSVMREHRTLQQRIFEVMLACISEWANTEHYDLRNEFTVQKCREIMSLFPGGAKVPLI